MQKFIKKSLFFFGGIVSLLIVFFPIWFQFYTLPPPNVSNSISLNAKVLYLKDNLPKGNIDILSIGSSMSLNNINSNSIAKNQYNKNYINVSSWGLNIEESFNLLKTYNIKYNPKTVIISSNLVDFFISKQKIKYNIINKFLASNNFNIHYLKFWSFSQAIRDSRLLSLYKYDNTIYESLKFDKYGGVNYPGNNFKINDKRWQGEKLKNYSIDTIQYSYLDSISKYCSSNGIKFVFIQSPFREGYYSKLKKEELCIIQNHIDKVEIILNNTNSLFVNSLVENWNDRLFVDFTHLNEEGSRLYTEYFLEQMKMHELRTKNSYEKP
jgi:hypothetical protein